MFANDFKARITVLMQYMFGVVLCFTGAPAFAAADYAREKRWADEIVPGIIVGEPVYLEQQNRHRFLGIYAEGGQDRMALIIVHGMGVHPDWGMVSTLRQRLHDYGYATLSIQMPVLAKDAGYQAYPAVFPEAVERLRIAVAWLRQRGYQRAAIVSHSNGSRMSRVYMAGNPAAVSAWVSLSLTQGDTFAGIRAPILDLYGENDLPHVLSSVAERKASLTHAASRQILIPRTDHFFAGQEEAMIGQVKDFLDGIK